MIFCVVTYKCWGVWSDIHQEKNNVIGVKLNSISPWILEVF